MAVRDLVIANAAKRRRRRSVSRLAERFFFPIVDMGAGAWFSELVQIGSTVWWWAFWLPFLLFRALHWKLSHWEERPDLDDDQVLHRVRGAQLGFRLVIAAQLDRLCAGLDEGPRGALLEPARVGDSRQAALQMIVDSVAAAVDLPASEVGACLFVPHRGKAKGSAYLSPDAICSTQPFLVPKAAVEVRPEYDRNPGPAASYRNREPTIISLLDGEQHAKGCPFSDLCRCVVSLPIFAQGRKNNRVFAVLSICTTKRVETLNTAIASECSDSILVLSLIERLAVA